MRFDPDGATAGAHSKIATNTKVRGLPLTARIVLLLAVLAAAGLYLRPSSRVYRAERWAENATPENLKTASRLEPSNAEFRYRIGRYSLLMQDFPDAIANLQAAIALNPHAAHYWLDLASADLATDNVAGTQQALAIAMDAYPTSPSVIWQTANYELVQGETALALRRFNYLVEHDPDMLAPSLNVCWRATQDPELIAERVLPKRPEDYLTLMRFLENKRPPGAPTRVWPHLIALKQPFPVRLAFPYIDYLISRGDLLPASEAWAQMASVNPKFQAYIPDGNQIVNGGFELDLLYGGFDWRYAPNPGASVIIDDHRAHSGNRSLAITFDGTPDDSGVFQLVPVRANTPYHFSGYLMAEDLETISPPRFSIFGLRGHKQYLLTDGVTGSTDWQEFQGKFTTGAEDDLLLVRIVRVPGQRLIRGKVWVDDVKLVPEAINGALR